MTTPAGTPALVRALVPTDLDRADAAIRHYRLSRPNDPVGEFTYPRDERGRHCLAAFIYDVVDAYAARAVLDAPARRRVTYTPPNSAH